MVIQMSEGTPCSVSSSPVPQALFPYCMGQPSSQAVDSTVSTLELIWVFGGSPSQVSDLSTNDLLMIPPILKSKEMWRQAACLPKNQAGAARRAEHLIFYLMKQNFLDISPCWEINPKVCPLTFCPCSKQNPFHNTATFPRKRFSFCQHQGWGYLFISFQMGASSTFPLPLKCAHKKRVREPM